MIERVLKWIKTEDLLEAGDCVIAGVSGGADSVCLLLLLLEIQKNVEITLRVVHVEHGIRGEESVEDAAFVEQLCETYHVPCHCYAIDVPAYAKKMGLGLEEAARVLRYECFEKEIAQTKQTSHKIKIALAHHADDNAETMLFQMIRGSGIDGLAGMRAKRSFAHGTEIIRPLLMIQRWEIESYLKEVGQEYRIDSTNLDTDYSRNHIRHEVIPKLTEVNKKAVLHMSRSASLLRQVADYLKSQIEESEKSCCIFSENEVKICVDDFLRYPEFIQSKLLHDVIGKMARSSKDIGAVHVDVLRELFDKQVGKSVDLPYNLEGRREYKEVTLVKKINSQSELPKAQKEYDCLTQEEKKRLEAGERVTIDLEDGQMIFRVRNVSGEIGQIHKKKYTKCLNYDKIKGNLQIRRRRIGDYLTVDLRGHKKKLKEYFINEKIPGKERETMWLLAEESHIIWVVGGRISTYYKIDEDTKRILEVQIVGGNYYEDQEH